MPKQIEDTDSLQYKKQLAEFMQSINPKPTEEILELMQEKYRKAREGK
jgi:hypothetical protein